MKSSLPFVLRLVCVAGFIGAFLTMILMFSPIIWQVGAWYPAYLSVSTAAVVFCLYGLWMMRRQAVWGYSALTVLNQAVYLFANQWKPVILILPTAVLAAGLFYYRRMK